MQTNLRTRNYDRVIGVEEAVESFCDPRERERALAALAGRQHGVASVRQLEGLGLTGVAIRRRVAYGRLHRVHRGVYALGHRSLTREAHWLAAVLACGPGAVLSHRSAAALLGLLSGSGRIEVTVPPHNGSVRPGRARPGIQLRRPMRLDPEDVTQHEEIPCTTVARTLADLAGVLRQRELERALGQAQILRVFDLYSILGVLERSPRRRGSHALRRALGNLDPSAEQTRSEMERRFLSLCRSAGFTPPVVNAPIDTRGGTFEADFAWRRAKLIVETDGFRSHGTQQAFEHDRYRDQCLAASGWRVVRLTWQQLVSDPQRIVSTLRPMIMTHTTRAL